MNHLSLFSGVGGGDLAHQHMLGWRTVGYVEWDAYCQRVLAQRMKDEVLQTAPIFGDVDGFIESGCAKKYKGFVDVLTAGFPCQPFSVAGKRRLDDPRNKWPQTIQCIRDVRPRYALLENVPGLLNSGYFPEILGSLAEAGFDARWVVLGADDVGAPHRRKRLWVLADSASKGLEIRETGQLKQSLSQIERGGFDVADSDSAGLSQRRRAESVETQHTTAECSSEEQSPGRWPTEPRLGRVVPHGLANRNERLKAIGNGQVSRVVATAWALLTQ